MTNRPEAEALRQLADVLDAYPELPPPLVNVSWLLARTDGQRHWTSTTAQQLEASTSAVILDNMYDRSETFEPLFAQDLQIIRYDAGPRVTMQLFVALNTEAEQLAHHDRRHGWQR